MAEGGEPSSQHITNVQHITNNRSIHMRDLHGNAYTGDNSTGVVTTSRQEETQHDIAAELEDWCRGMVETCHYHQLLQMIDQGEKWITVKGSPGEGKTTTVRMALRQIKKSGRDVFIVKDPGLFQHIAGTYPRAVIMLDDILGDIEFNIRKWNKWENVFHQQLDLKEHLFNEGGNIKSEANGPTVILISRDYVLNGAANEMGGLYTVITKESRVINMSHPTERDTKERRKILEAVVLSHVKLSKADIDNILLIDGGHGFPHVCRMFATMRKSSLSPSPQDFFEKPLHFLNKTMTRFIKGKDKNKNKLCLFKEMLKRSGQISERELEQIDTEVKQEAEQLLGSYLKKESGYYIFDHPSIYDSVSFTLGSVHTVFVIENCSMSFIYERIRLQSANNPDHRRQRDNDLVVYISDVYKVDLAKRFAQEIQERELWYVLSHQACTDEDFVGLMISHVNIPLRSLFQITNCCKAAKGITEFNFLALLALNKSGEIFRYIESRPDIQLSEEDIKYVLCGVCAEGDIDMFNHLIECGYKLDVHARYGTRHYTLLMHAVYGGNSEIVDKLLSLGCDVSAVDGGGHTALHLACLMGRVGVVERLLEAGVGVDSGKKTDGVETVGEGRVPSPLGCACFCNNTDVVELLLARGARVTAVLENIARKMSNPDIQRLILRNKMFKIGYLLLLYLDFEKMMHIMYSSFENFTEVVEQVAREQSNPDIQKLIIRNMFLRDMFRIGYLLWLYLTLQKYA